MITYTDDKICDVTDGIILHVVNCKGSTNTNIFAVLTKKYPQVLTEHEKTCKWYSVRTSLLYGKTLINKINENLTIANIYGCMSETIVQRNILYKAIKTALTTIEANLKKRLDTTNDKVWKIHMPYRMGCDNKKGEWFKIEEILEEIFKNSLVEVVIHKN